ncbi:MAG: hypothetical protein GX621_00700, partial [Pirellulaceae bacterium]|nr:hypothetical protein [Pirellulaceae bacterium]
MSSALLLLATIIASTSICVHKDSDQTVTGQTKSLIFCLGASPDGKLLAVGGIRYPTLERRAGVMDLKTKQLRCFGTPKGVMGPTLYVPASWSSDSKQLAFGLLTAPANVPPGYWEQQIMDAAAGKITADDLGYYFQLWTASAETGEARSLSVSNSRQWNYPRFSPDAKRILAYDLSSSNVALISVPSRSSLGFLLPSTVWSRAGVHYLGYDWDPAG